MKIVVRAKCCPKNRVWDVFRRLEEANGDFFEGVIINVDEWIKKGKFPLLLNTPSRLLFSMVSKKSKD